MKWLAITGAIIAVAVVIFKVNHPTYSYRYRLQLSLAVDGKVHTGSSVIEVTWERGPKIAELRPVRSFRFARAGRGHRSR